MRSRQYWSARLWRAQPYPANRAHARSRSFALPVELKLGIAASSALNVGLGIGIPFWIQFGAGNGVVVPFLIGGGAEYFLRSDLAVFFDLRMGPTIFGNARPATFTFDAKIGVGWHL